MTPALKSPRHPSHLPRLRSRWGGGTILIVVLVIISAIVFMALAQYFAESVTKGRRILHEMVAMDYLGQAAIDEALVWFRGKINGLGAPPSDATLKTFHAAVVNGGVGSAPPLDFTATQAAALAVKMSVGGGDQFTVEKVKVEFANIEDIGAATTGAPTTTPPATSATGPTTGKESKGRILFKTLITCGKSTRAVCRAYEFRQVIIAPPAPFADVTLGLRNWQYMALRIKRYVTESEDMRKAFGAVARVIYFGIRMLKYVIDPQPGFNVGPQYASQVMAVAANQMPTLQSQLQSYASRPPPNPNFNVGYLQDMAAAHPSGAQNLDGALSQFTGSGAGGGATNDPDLKDTDGFPLSPLFRDGSQVNEPQGDPQSTTAAPAPTSQAPVPAEAQSSNFVKPYLDTNGSQIPIKKWGYAPGLNLLASIENDLKRKDPVVKLKGDPNNDKLTGPSVVAVARLTGSQTISLADLKIKMRPPPVFPGNPVGSSGSGSSSSAPATPGGADMAQAARVGLENMPSASRYAELASQSGDFPDEAKQVAKDDKCKVPVMQVDVPKTEYDWAFRIKPDYYKSKFASLGSDVTAWITDVRKKASTYHTDWDSQSTAAFKDIEIAAFSDAQTLVIQQEAEASKRASWKFPTEAAMRNVMKAQLNAAGKPSAGNLALNGVAMIDGGDLTLTETGYIGHGMVVTKGTLKLGSSMARNGPVGNLVLWSTNKDKPLELANGSYTAMIVAAGVLKGGGSSCTIKGSLVIEDTPAGGSGGTGSAQQDATNAEHYWTNLPEAKVTAEARDLVGSSHFTFSPYRVASGGFRSSRP